MKLYIVLTFFLTVLATCKCSGLRRNTFFILLNKLNQNVDNWSFRQSIDETNSTESLDTLGTLTSKAGLYLFLSYGRNLTNYLNNGTDLLVEAFEKRVTNQNELDVIDTLYNASNFFYAGLSTYEEPSENTLLLKTLHETVRSLIQSMKIMFNQTCTEECKKNLTDLQTSFQQTIAGTLRLLDRLMLSEVPSDYYDMYSVIGPLQYSIQSLDDQNQTSTKNEQKLIGSTQKFLTIIRNGVGNHTYHDYIKESLTSAADGLLRHFEQISSSFGFNVISNATIVDRVPTTSVLQKFNLLI